MAVNRIKIGMGEGAVAGEPQVLSAPGIGSCVVLVLYDSERRIGGMAHVMLPDTAGPGKDASAYQFAETAITTLLKELRDSGAVLCNLVAKMAGGAAMFPSYGNGSAGIGRQIIHRIKDVLRREGIPLVGWDLAGHHGRSVEFHLASGQMIVKVLGSTDRSF